MIKRRRKKGINKKYLVLFIMVIFILICGLLPLKIVGNTMGITKLAVTSFDSPDVFIVAMANQKGSNVFWTGKSTAEVHDVSILDPAIHVELSQPNFEEKIEEDEYIDYKFIVGFTIKAVSDKIGEGLQALNDYVVTLEFDYKGKGDFKSIEIVFYQSSESNTSIAPSAKSTELYLKNNFSRTNFTIHKLKAKHMALIQMEMTVRYENEIDPYQGLNYSWKWLFENWRQHGFWEGTINFLGSLTGMAKYASYVFFGLLIMLGVVMMGMIIWGVLDRDPKEFADSIWSVGVDAAKGVGGEIKSGAGKVHGSAKPRRVIKKVQKAGRKRE